MLWRTKSKIFWYKNGLFQSNRSIDTRDWRHSWQTNSCTISQALQIKYERFSNESATDDTHDWAQKAEQTLPFFCEDKLIEFSKFASSYGDAFFEMNRVVQIACTYSITSVEAERAFSYLKLIKILEQPCSTRGYRMLQSCQCMRRRLNLLI